MVSSRIVLDVEDTCRTKTSGLGLGLGFEHPWTRPELHLS